MTEVVLEWRKYRYFPYERAFAWLETERLFATSPCDSVDGLRIPANSFKPERAERLTYFAQARHPAGTVVIPRQARLEASAGRDGQSTRYSAHGLHEYKGKFNPQVVRAIGNMLGLQDDAWVLDPFCGSGTTLLECAHSGWNGFGVDRNPLAVRIAKAKLRALLIANGPLEEIAETLERAIELIANDLADPEMISAAEIEPILGSGWERELPFAEYLLSWFPEAVLAQFVWLRRAIHSHARAMEDRAIFETILSDQLRSVSYQEPADLRIRRRKQPKANYPLLRLFAAAVNERVPRIVLARRELSELMTVQTALLGDIRTLDFKSAIPAKRADQFDAVITSPPYETALPYIDTQRLSLVAFGDISPHTLHTAEQGLIGAREIRTRERRELEQAIASGDRTTVPQSVVDLCRELLDATSRPGNGFRRLNRPALVFRYFLNMRAFFENIRPWLRPTATVALVVGRNRTVLGGREYEIDTPRLLGDVAETCGYVVLGQHPMETYPRYDLHQRNSINAESLLLLAKA